jgi:hypothetical protein
MESKTLASNMFKMLQTCSKWFGSNMFKMVQTCSIFVGSFSQCLNLVESGHKAGNIGTTECPSENARPHHITPPPTMQNLGAAISLWQLQNAHIHECFGTVIP